MSAPSARSARSSGEPTIRLLALSGGVGGAKMARALLEHLEATGGDPAELLVVCNTGDDFEHLGLHVSPDVDSVLYRLADLHDEDRGWGRRDETWRFLGALEALGGETWFQLGDRDLATHVRRTELLRSGSTLGDATRTLARALGVPCAVAPMSDDPVRTRIHTARGPLDFQHWFVRERCEPAVTGFSFEGVDRATPGAALARALTSPDLERVVLCPSNPWVSLDPILALPTVTETLASLDVPRIAVSPILGGRALKGPAAKMMGELGLEVSARSVARHYAERGLISHFLVDPQDEDLAPEIEAFGVEVLVAPALLDTPERRTEVARAVAGA